MPQNSDRQKLLQDQVLDQFKYEIAGELGDNSTNKRRILGRTELP